MSATRRIMRRAKTGIAGGVKSWAAFSAGGAARPEADAKLRQSTALTIIKKC